MRQLGLPSEHYGYGEIEELSTNATGEEITVPIEAWFYEYEDTCGCLGVVTFFQDRYGVRGRSANNSSCRGQSDLSLMIKNAQQKPGTYFRQRERCLKMLRSTLAGGE